MQKSYSLIAIILLLTLSFCAENGHAQEPRSVSVSGSVINRVKPDGVTWSIQLKTQNPELAMATAENNTQVEAILELRKALKVEPNDIQTGQLSIRKVYFQDDRRNQGDFRFYEVRRTITITQRNLGDFESTLEQLSGMKNIELSHSLFCSDYHKIRRQTRIEAVRVAREKAREMAESVDATIGDVLQIEEATPSNQMAFTNRVQYSGDSVTEDEVKGTFAPGSISIQVSVKAKFELK